MYKQHQPLTVNVISDIHYYAKSVGITGPDFIKANSKSPNDLLNNVEILEALERQLEKDDADIVLVSGDITYNAEPDSHKGAVELLRKLKKSGKKVYVITATHDYHDNNKTLTFDENGSHEIDATRREELWELYHEFGPDEAISVHRQSMSYVVQLCDGYRLFALNDDSNLSGASGFSEDCFKWITAQIADAKKNGQFIIPMTHHPMITPSPFYTVIGASNMMGEHEKRRVQLADMGVPFMLTGHTHIQDISYIYSPKGNIFYDITTASPAGYPGTYRRIIFDPANHKIDVKAIEITEKPDFDMKGETVREHLEEKFFGMIRDVIDAAANDTDKFARMATAFSIRSELIYKVGWIIRPFAKLLKKLKIKTVAKLCKKESGLKKSDYADIADEKVVNFIISLVTNLYGGDAAYAPNTAYYKITLGACSIIDSILETLGINISKLLKYADSVSSLVEPLLFNGGIPDGEATLELYPLYTSDNPMPERKEEPKPESGIKKSKKGKGIIAGLVICAVILSPLILIWLIFGFLFNQIRFFKQLHGKDEK